MTCVERGAACKAMAGPEGGLWLERVQSLERSWGWLPHCVNPITGRILCQRHRDGGRQLERWFTLPPYWLFFQRIKV